MPRSFASARPGRNSENRLRSETAAIYRALTHGVSKWIAAERGCGLSRIHRMAEGLDANPVELLIRDMDRVANEGEAERCAEVVAFFESRYTSADSPGDGIEDDIAEIARQAGELIGSAIEKARDGVDDDELADLGLLVFRLKSRLDLLLCEAKKSNAAGKQSA